MMSPAEVVRILRDPAALESVIARHGLPAVVDEMQREHVSAYVAWLRPDFAPLADDRRRAVLDAVVKHDALRAIADACMHAGITAMVFKGAAWAFTHYPEPWCRRFLDIDLLIAPADKRAMFGVLESLGYQRAGRITGQLVNAQEVFERTAGNGAPIVVDLHWQISNRVRLARFLPTAEVMRHAVPAPFAPGLVQASVQDALLLACLHPFAHHAEAAPLKWVLDVRYLAAGLDLDAAQALLARAQHGGVAALVRRALQDAAQLTIPETTSPLLDVAWLSPPVKTSDDPWLDETRREANDALDDLRALPTWRARGRLIREHLLPPPWFMQQTYGSAHRWRLPWLYLHRLATGGPRWIGQWWRSRRQRRPTSVR